MLKFAGYTNIVLSIAHLIGLFWAKWMFEVTGIGKEMQDLAQTHFSLPYLVTVLVSTVFFIFGLYGMSAGGKMKKLPFLKVGIFSIAAVYIFRGLIGLFTDITEEPANPTLTVLYSVIALLIGLLFLFGGISKWAVRKNNNTQHFN
ncbi:hypothetical protein [Maribacter sp. 2307ULW6-5]|uniref:hypothetical protein n=1 Tax=Maribacter sp. 2307ULW6-5 TaxID=3386275 RepID=UPI0039BCB27C